MNTHMHARRVARTNRAARKKTFSDVTVLYVPSSAFDGANKVYLLIPANITGETQARKKKILSLSGIKTSQLFCYFCYFRSVIKIEEYQFVNKCLISCVLLSIWKSLDRSCSRESDVIDKQIYWLLKNEQENINEWLK